LASPELSFCSPPGPPSQPFADFGVDLDAAIASLRQASGCAKVSDFGRVTRLRILTSWN
jgi:hypothetical protein